MSDSSPAGDASQNGRFYPLIDTRCTHRDHGDNPNVYRCVGSCSNCRSGPYLLLVTAGHRKPTGQECPKCGCYDVRADRLAEDDELPEDPR